MIVSTDSLVAMTEANQNFSEVSRLVEEKGTTVILKSDKLRYAVIDFNEYDPFQTYRSSLIEQTADSLIEENHEAFWTWPNDPATIDNIKRRNENF